MVRLVAAVSAGRHLDQWTVARGALSMPGGRVRIEWQVRPRKMLFIRWAERGGPAVQPPTRQGFGTRLMDQMICSQLKGEVNFEWRTEGVAREILVGI